MLNNNEILLETTDFDLAKKLMQAKIDGVTIGVYQTRSFPTEEIAKFIISFVKDAGLIYFGHWLSTHKSKVGADKTAINKNEIPQTVEQITALIKHELEYIQKEQPTREERRGGQA